MRLGMCEDFTNAALQNVPSVQKNGREEIMTISLFDNDDDVDVIKSKVKGMRLDCDSSSSDECLENNDVVPLNSKSGNTKMPEAVEYPGAPVISVQTDYGEPVSSKEFHDEENSIEEREESVIQTSKGKFKHIYQSDYNQDTEENVRKETESSNHSVEVLLPPNNVQPNEIQSITRVNSGLLISPIKLTQDISVDVCENNNRLSSVLENISLPLVYIPTTRQLVAGRKSEITGINGNDEPKVQEHAANAESPKIPSDDENECLESANTENSLNPAKMTHTSDEDGDQVDGFWRANHLSDTCSLGETDSLIRIQEPDQITCDSIDFESAISRNNSTSDSLMRTFNDASSLSSISTGTDFSISAASVGEEGIESSGLCIDTGDAGFMEISLHSRNSYEKTKNLSEELGHEEMGGKPKRRGLSGFLSRNLFSRKQKDGESPPNNVLGWKLFGRIPPKQVPSKDPEQICCEYQAKQRAAQLLASRAKKQDIEVMSTTALILENRPMNLPSKDPEEAERHRQEYETMVEAAKKKEQRELRHKKKALQQQRRQEDMQVAASRLWTNDIVPNWDTMKTSKKARDLWWRGIPPCVRGKVWKLAIGNDLNLTPELYEICVSRAVDRIKVACESGETYGTSETSSEPPSSKESSVELIKLDISRTFPQLCIFQKGGPYHDLLHSLLGAYVCYRPDVGYVQGMSFIAAVLLLNMEVAEAFICLGNLLNKPCQLAFFRMDEVMMKSYFNTYEELFKENMPDLHSHFVKCSVTPDLYIIDWIFTLFSKSLPLDVACRVWDVFCRDGEEFLFRTAMGILKLHEEILANLDFIHLAQFLTRLPEDICADHLFQCIDSIRMNIDKRRFLQILSSHREVIEAT